MLRLFHSGSCLQRLVTIAVLISCVGCDSRDEDRNRKSVPQPGKISGTAEKSDGWIQLDAIGKKHWLPIDGAAEILWNEESKTLKIGSGYDLNGVRWDGETPSVPYEIELEAKRTSGADFFCGLTLPVRDGSQHVSLIIGGWGGNLVGISSVQGLDASENSTSSYRDFEDNRWYHIKVRVKKEHISAWIDDEEVIDLLTEGQRLSLRPGQIEECAPLGIATWLTEAEIRGIRWRLVADPD